MPTLPLPFAPCATSALIHAPPGLPPPPPCRRTVRYVCLGAHIPSGIQLDVRTLDLDQFVRLEDLPVPYGTRMTMKVGRGMKA